MLYYYTNFYKVFGVTTKDVVSNFSIKILIISSSCSYILIKFINEWLKSSVKKNQLNYDIKIIYKNNECIIRAFLDTGNTLVEPISKNDVIIVEYGKLKNILSDNVKIALDEKFDIQNFFLTINIEETSNFKLIPFSSVGNENDLLLGFIPDEILINIDGKYKKLNNTIIGICNFKLNSNNEYEALLNNNILNLED